MKKNLMTVLVLALLVVNIVLTTVMMLSVMSVNSKTSELITNIATVMNLELTGGASESDIPQVSLADTEVHSLVSAMTIPLKVDVDGKQAYIVFNIAFSINKKHDDYATYGANIGTYDDLIKDEINTVVSSHTETECRNNIDGLKKDILVSIQRLFDSDFIYKVSLSEVKYG